MISRIIVAAEVGILSTLIFAVLARLVEGWPALPMWGVVFVVYFLGELLRGYVRDAEKRRDSRIPKVFE